MQRIQLADCDVIIYDDVLLIWFSQLADDMQRVNRYVSIGQQTTILFVANGAMLELWTLFVNVRKKQIWSQNKERSLE